MTNNNPLRITRDYDDAFCTPRAIAYLNFALHLRIDADAARTIAFDALDDDSNNLDIAATPIPSDARTTLLALANELFNSDDDFDDFIHELDHAARDCADPDYCASDLS